MGQIKLIGRIREMEKLDKLMRSSKSEFLAVYGRRRVGKTFLIRQYFDNEFDFYTTGLAKGNTTQQLTNFTIFINNYFSEHHAVPKNWLEAFNLLIKGLEKTKSDFLVSNHGISSMKITCFLSDFVFSNPLIKILNASNQFLGTA